MKRFLLICLTAMFAVASWAYEFSDGGFYYNIVSGDGLTCTVTSGDNAYTGDIVIPSTAQYGSNYYTVVGISEMAFQNCTGVTSVSIPNTVTSVGMIAFAGCTSLTTVTFEEGEEPLELATDGILGCTFDNCPITTLYMGRQYSSTGGSTHPAFMTLSTLESVTLGQYVTELEYCAFHDCSSLKELIIEDSDTELYFNTAIWDGYDFYYDDETGDKTEPFYQCPIATLYQGRNIDYSLTSESTSKHSPFYSSAVKKALTTVTFGEKVTKIGYTEFSNCSLLTGVVLPESVTTIEYAAFSATGITEIVLGDNVTTLSGNAFYKCSSLVVAEIGNGVSSLNSNMFYQCSALETVTLGENIASVGGSAFRECTALKSVTSLNHTPPTVSNTDTSNTSCPFYSVEVGNVTLYVPEGTMEDYENNAMWTQFTIQEIVEEKTQFEVEGIYYKVIDPEADEKKVEVTYGGESASSGTEAYKDEITIPATVNYNNTLYTVIGIGDNAFRNCEELESVTIAEENITYIGENAFRESSIKTVSLGAVETIHEHAFAESGLTSLTIPDNVTTIEPYAFYYCTSLESLTLGKGLTYIDECVFDSIGIKSLVIPDNIEEIGPYAFNRCMHMTSLEIGSGLKTIGEYAFYWSGLTELTIPSTVSTIGRYAFSDNLSLVTLTVDAETVGNEAFYGCDNLTSVKIGDNVRSLGTGAFEFCPTLPSITIPGTTTVGTWVFAYCYNLKEVIIGEGITTCGSWVFRDCTNLSSVTLPDSFTDLAMSMFENCTALKSITLPVNLKYAGGDSFAGTSLEEIYSLNPTPPSFSSVNGSGMSAFYETCTLYVPCDYVEAYTTASVWENFVNIQGIDCQEELGEFACTVDPADKSVLDEPLSQITFSNEYGIYYNEEEEYGYEGEPIVVYDSEDNDVAYIENIYGTEDVDGKVIDQMVIFNTEVTEVGDYTVVVPACFFYSIDEEGRRGFNEQFTLTYTISEISSSEPDYEIVVSPESGETLESLSTISLTCEDGIMWNTLGWGDIVIYDEKDNPLDVVIDYEEVASSTSLITEVILTISPEITVDGEYRVEIPEGYFLISGNVESKAITLEYTIKVNGGTETGIGGVSLTGENVEGIYSTSGQKLNTTVRGVNIVLYNDGTVKKIYVK